MMLPLPRLGALAAQAAAALALAFSPATHGPAAQRPESILVMPRDALVAAIDSMVGAPIFRNAQWGILIVDPQRADTIYSRQAGKLFTPASNMKIVTAAVALARLGPDFRFGTTLLARGEQHGDTLVGDLVVEGRGDPSLSDHMRVDAMAPLREMADSLAARGIHLITGRILPGADVFPAPALGAGWAWDDLGEPYGAGVDELYFNEGFTRIRVQGGAHPGEPATATTAPAPHAPPLRVTAVTVGRGGAPPGPDRLGPLTDIELLPDSSSGGLVVAGRIGIGGVAAVEYPYPSPQRAFLSALGDALAERGIIVAGREDSAYAAPPAVPLLVYRSPPLREILPAMLKPSQNQIAEILLRTLGLEGTGVGVPDSGQRIESDQLLSWGVQPDGYIIHDGSGLSRYDYLTPETIVRVLAAMQRDSSFPAYYAALPVAGVDGTIEARMASGPARGNVHAKTGSMAAVRSLSGYVTTPDGRTLIFSILCNSYSAPGTEVSRVEDAIASRLAALSAAGGG